MENETNFKIFIKPTAVCLAIMAAFSMPAFAADGSEASGGGNTLTLPNPNDSFNKDTTNGWKDFNTYQLKGEDASFSGLKAEFEPAVIGGQFLVTVSGTQEKTATFKVNGDTFIRSTSTPSTTSINDSETSDGQPGTYLFDAKSGGTIVLNGNIDVELRHANENYGDAYVGANFAYANGKDAVITLGNQDSSTKAWVFAPKADLMSAKQGAKVELLSTNNQLIGSIDSLESNPSTENTSMVSGTFSGSNSYWYGDEQGFKNLAITNLDELSSGILKNGMTVEQIANLDINKLPENISQALLGLINYAKTLKLEEIDLKFCDGAQWSYLGSVESQAITKMGLTISGSTLSKRISSITLLGGVINLADDDLEARWKDLGFYEDLKEQELLIDHDYVRIGELKGDGGIFRIDLNSDQSQSDMIFIEKAEGEHTHYIQPYTLDNVKDLSGNLIFALTAKDAAGVTFEETTSLNGKGLYDYQLTIDSDTVDKEIIGDLAEIKVGESAKYDFDLDAFNEGKYWFISDIERTVSNKVYGLNSAGYASYDAAIQMDRHDRRLREMVYEDSQNASGLWVRMQHGQMGAKGAYTSDINTVYVGIDGALTENLRLGASLSVMDGSADFHGIKGSSDLTRYEAALYGTYTNDAHYVDVVARFGRINNDLSMKSGESSSADFDQDYAAISAEYGYKLQSKSGLFLEPQLQMQAAYLGGYDYAVDNSELHVDAAQTTSLIGRAGLRMGKTFASEETKAEIYVRGDVLHQFTDGQDGKISDSSETPLGQVWGDAGTWYNYGIGGYLNWKNRFGAQFDVEKSSGGEVADTWLLSGRISYYF